MAQISLAFADLFSQIKITKVKAAIFNEPTLKSAEINVETFKGAVQYIENSMIIK